MVKKLDALELWKTYLNKISCVESKVTILKQMVVNMKKWQLLIKRVLSTFLTLTV